MRSREGRLFSFEFSPPRSEDAAVKQKRAWGRLNALAPDFYSVTFGAGGSTREGTFQTVAEMSEGSVPVAPHISFGGDAPGPLVELLNAYIERGIHRLVAIRGDIPSGLGSHHSLPYANELVSFIRAQTGDHFHIEVAAYPETHPESDSVASEIRYFKQKVDAGANSAITQYFYNPDAYFSFIEQCDKAGLDIAIVPGIMPIVNYENLVRFSDKCGAEIPRWIRKRMESYEGDRESIRAFGDEVVTRLCERLLDGGAPGLHFYTLNQALPSIRVWRNLDLPMP